MSTPIITAKTASENSTPFHVREDDPVTIFAAGTLVSETITLQISSGSAWFGTGQTLSASEPCLTCYGPGTYRAVKPTTANSVGVEVSSRSYGI